LCVFSLEEEGKKEDGIWRGEREGEREREREREREIDF